MAYQLNNNGNGNFYVTIIAYHNNQLPPENVLRDRNEQISDKDRPNKTFSIYNVLRLYAIIHQAILTAVVSLHGRIIGCDISSSPLILLSGMFSAAIILVILFIFYREFNAMRGGRNLVSSLFDHRSWVAQKAAITVMLVAFSVALFYCILRLSCSPESSSYLRHR